VLRWLHNENVDQTGTASQFQLPSRWAGVPARLPSSLADLDGPAGGVVELPVDLAWSGDRAFDLADADERYLYFMTVLTAGVDVHAASGMFTGPELIALARHVLQEEFSLESLRDRLEYGAAVPDEQYARYGCPAERITEIRTWAQEWAAQLSMEIAVAEPRDDDG
jgi:hypothetical protein